MFWSNYKCSVFSHCDALNIKSVVEFLPHSLQHILCVTFFRAIAPFFPEFLYTCRKWWNTDQSFHMHNSTEKNYTVSCWVSMLAISINNLNKTTITQNFPHKFVVHIRLVMVIIQSIKFNFSPPNITSNMDISNNVKFLGTSYMLALHGHHQLWTPFLMLVLQYSTVLWWSVFCIRVSMGLWSSSKLCTYWMSPLA